VRLPATTPTTTTTGSSTGAVVNQTLRIVTQQVADRLCRPSCTVLQTLHALVTDASTVLGLSDGVTGSRSVGLPSPNTSVTTNPETTPTSLTSPTTSYGCTTVYWSQCESEFAWNRLVAVVALAAMSPSSRSGFTDGGAQPSATSTLTSTSTSTRLVEAYLSLSHQSLERMIRASQARTGHEKGSYLTCSVAAGLLSWQVHRLEQAVLLNRIIFMSHAAVSSSSSSSSDPYSSAASTTSVDANASTTVISSGSGSGSATVAIGSTDADTSKDIDASNAGSGVGYSKFTAVCAETAQGEEMKAQLMGWVRLFFTVCSAAFTAPALFLFALVRRCEMTYEV
jgi:hypothetical protein